MAVVEIFLAAFLKVLLNRLTDDFLNFARQGGIDKKLKKWKDILAAIGAVLHDAEEKQLTSEAVKLWLDDLKDLAYDVEDVLDEFSTEMIHSKVKEQQYGATMSKVRGFIPKIRFSFNFNSKIKLITDQLQDISERKDKLGLTYIGTISTSKKWLRPPSSCVLGGTPVVGRDGDKAKIVEFLSRDEPGTINFHVVAIVGMPGLGKTTLAQYIFNDSDDDVLKQFNLKVWVSVSDNFNIVRVTKAILESVTSQHCQWEEFSQIQDGLRKELASKKYLIVLDDIWNSCDYDLWMTLQSPFHAGAPGSKIIVTTRDAGVAKIVRAIDVHNLDYISNDDCWKVFKQHALLDVSNCGPQNFEVFRGEIVAKCGGLPLAARTLGGLLGCKEIHEWGEILENKLWSLSDNSNILPVLNLSYHYLPSDLKRCFAYCSILPQDYEFEEMQLILLWMAEDLIPQPKDNKQLEDLGADYFRELLSRSFFQNSSKSNARYVMHDLISDLARKITGAICFRLEDAQNSYRQIRSSPKARHLSYISGISDGVQKFEAFDQVKHVRTFLPFTVSTLPGFRHCLTRKITHDLVPKLPYLRVLSFNGYGITDLPKSIGELKSLRYLDVSHAVIKDFPESASTLYNLQTLIVNDCNFLRTLPTNMRNLISLRHLHNSKLYLLERMPAQLGSLTNLQTLNNFLVAESGDSGISQIGPLLHLRGTLHLSRLENVNDAEDAKMANCIKKEKIDELVLEWSENREMRLDVLDMLQPHKNLKMLTVRGFRGLQFSAWIGDSLFSKMVVVRLENCRNCQLLPPLGQLCSLKELYIRKMPGVVNVGQEFYGEGSLPFPRLEILEFERMDLWKEWFSYQQDQGLETFPCLKMLSIKNCWKLQGRLPENLHLLSTLVIHQCEQLVVSITNYKSLCELKINNCRQVIHRSAAQFESLEALELSSISEFVLQAEEFVRGLTKTKDLKITVSKKPTFLRKNEDRILENPISVPHFFIGSNSHLVLFHYLSSLQKLHIYDCSSIISFEEVCFPPFLKEIEIVRCHSLVYFARYQIAPQLRRLSIRVCKNFKSLVEIEVGSTQTSSYWSSSSSASTPCLMMQKETSSLEDLEINSCPSMTSLGYLLIRTLKHLQISDCANMEKIVDRFHDNILLEEIQLWTCPNLKSFPEGLCHLTNLLSLSIINCESFVSFPREVFPRSAFNLRMIEISNCHNLEGIPKGMQNLNSLQDFQGLASFLEEGFPTNLTRLVVWKVKNCKALLELGLHSLTSLRELYISGEDPDLVSFPPEDKMTPPLPKSLIQITIADFPNLTKLSKGFQFLTSLEYLEVSSCPKLASIPEGGLPLSLTRLYAIQCPLLKERCNPMKGRYWSTIAHIPCITNGNMDIRFYSLQESRSILSTTDSVLKCCTTPYSSY